MALNTKEYICCAGGTSLEPICYLPSLYVLDEEERIDLATLTMYWCINIMYNR